ncbi:MAG: hypothetical protein ACI9MR_002749 [Myxococcota bacterium]|jgi:hypothetical protein
MPKLYQRRETEINPAIEHERKDAAVSLRGLGYDDQVAALAPDADGAAVQMRGEGAGQDAAQTHALAGEGIKGGGHALPHFDKIQAAFGHHDVSTVQAHTGSAAAAASKGMGAQAYASGSHVAFAGAPDLFTAAHEAAHTVQQRAGDVQLKNQVGEVGDRYETQADEVAQRVVAGQSATDILDKSASHGATTATAGAVQRRPTPTDGQPDNALSGAKLASAIRYNTGRRMAAEDWKKVADVVGASSGELNDELVQKIADWQLAKGLDADGKCGNITTQWLSQHGAAGLEQYVTSNATTYMGLNPNSRDKEHNKLKGQMGSKDLTAIKGSKKQDHVDIEGEAVDLSSDTGVERFVASLDGLDPSKHGALKSFLTSAGAMAKDELALMARHMNDVNNGKGLMKRVVLSGHSGGWSFWGDDNGWIKFDELQVLPQIFPIACGQPEDLILSACNTGQSGKLDQYKSIFPNLKSIWAYVGYSPSAANGSLKHVGMWDKVTRGAMDADKMHKGRETIAGQSGKRDKNIAVWTQGKEGEAESYETASPEAAEDYETVKAQVDAGMSAYDAAFDQGNIDKPTLDTLYTKLQVLVGMFRHRLGGEADRYELAMKRTLYLRYWSNIAKKFTETYGTQVKAGYEAAGANMPSFAGLKRNEALAAIAAYPGAAGDAGHKLLTDYLRDLLPSLIPDNWA